MWRQLGAGSTVHRGGLILCTAAYYCFLHLLIDILPVVCFMWHADKR
jgi:hypothetical protein